MNLAAANGLLDSYGLEKTGNLNSKRNLIADYCHVQKPI
jgi:hypothetical protein